MKVLHIVGRKNHGKTELVVQLVRELTRRGLRVGTFKNCGHEHDLDVPGKDSYKHREAGATTVAVITPSLTALYERRNPGQAQDHYSHFRDHFKNCDLILIEGDLEGPGPKLEVWGRIPGTEPLALTHKDVVAVVSDDNAEVPVPVWPRKDLPAIADKVPGLAKEI